MNGGRCTLRFKTGPLAGTTHSLGPGEYLYIGKGEGCALKIIDDPTVSEVHACLYYDPAGPVRLKDMGSEYGTFKNGKRLKSSTRLKAGDRVTIGQVSTFQSSWWNALQSTRLTRFTRISMMRKNVVAPSRDRDRRQRVMLAVLALVVVSSVVGFFFVRGAFDPMQLAAKEPPADDPKPAKTKAKAKKQKKTKIEGSPVVKSTAVTDNQRFIWDEIVSVSRRFGDPPPSAMDLGFVKLVERHVREFTINERHRGVLERKKTLWPTITKVLRERNLPVELGYIVWIESKFVKDAVSPVGAAGLWQFMPATAREYGLKVVEGGKDERYDIAKATVAASAYIRDLLRMFGTDRYLLAMASYNTGQFRVQRIQLAAKVHEAQRTDFWQIRHLLPAETNAYVPQIMAAIVVGRNPDRWTTRDNAAH